MTRTAIPLSLMTMCVFAGTLSAQFSTPPYNPPHYPMGAADIGPAHPDIDPHKVLVDKFNGGSLSLDDMRRLGLSVFATPFNSYDGLGDGAFLLKEWNEPPMGPMTLGHRPTLQGNGMFMRIHGLDAQNCNECHSVVSNRTRIPTLGLGGVGGISQCAFPFPTLIDIADSWEKRVHFDPHPNLPFKADGVADYNGRFINAPFLYGGGGVELLGKEMTDRLQYILEQASNPLNPPGLIYQLFTHGVSFGYLVTTGLGGVNFDHIDGIEKDLVVKPFGRKGEFISMRAFDIGAMQFHFGIQPVEVVGENKDEDWDGYKNEVTIGEMTVLHFFGVCNPPPVMDFITTTEAADVQAGSELFETVGCFECHRPLLFTDDHILPMSYPEVPTDPYANVYSKINLLEVGFTPTSYGGIIVPLFADLKRHDMGKDLMETADFSGAPNSEFTTARLWGISDTAPYLHDGRATTIYQAIYFHGGEAEQAKIAFFNLPVQYQKFILKYLMHLRTPEKPNEDLLPL